MKLMHIIVFFLISTLVACTQKENWKIEFCEEMNGENCVDSKDIFERNIKIYVTLESKELIRESIIVGNIYRMYDGTYDDYLGTKKFQIENMTHKLTHSIPFDELGGAGPHLIEFTREDGTLIISKELFIK